MQMTDENVINLMNGNLIAHQLHLHTFTAINQKMVVLDVQVLRGGKPPERRQRSART